MILIDANVLIYAFRKDTLQHDKYLQWLKNIVNGHTMFGVSDLVLSTVVRITTHPRIYKNPSSSREVLNFINAVRSCPMCLTVNPGPKHWDTFSSLIESLKLIGNDIPDAYLAALAIEWDYELVTTDQGFSRFPSLKWQHPFNQ